MTTPTLTIRTAAADDLAGIDAMLASSYPRLLRRDYAPSVLVTVVPVMARAQPQLVSSGRYLVAEVDGRLVGAGGWSLAPPPGGRPGRRRAHVRHVVTDYRAVRTGVGRRLMAAVMDAARTEGVRGMECLSTLTAVPFYVACGFSEVARLDLPIVPGIPFEAVRMVRAL